MTDPMPWLALSPGTTNSAWQEGLRSAIIELRLDGCAVGIPDPYWVQCKPHLRGPCTAISASRRLSAMRKVLSDCGFPPERAKSFSRHTFKRTWGNWCDVGGLSEPTRNILLHHKPGTGGSKMARTYTESELLEPVRLARKLLKRVRAGTLDIDNVTDLVVHLLPLDPVQDLLAGTLELDQESEGSDSSESDSSESSEVEEEAPKPSSSTRRAKLPRAVEPRVHLFQTPQAPASPLTARRHPPKTAYSPR